MAGGSHRCSRRVHARRMIELVGMAVAVIAVVVTPSAVAHPSSPALSPPAVTPSSDYVELTAGALAAADLVYDGVLSVPTAGNGTTAILRFTLRQGSFTDASTSLPCENGQSITTGSGNASITAATFDVVSLEGTIDGTQVAYSASAPPTDPFPAAVTIDNLRVSAISLTAGQLASPSLQERLTTC